MIRKFSNTSPHTQEETISAIYEELSDVPLDSNKEQTLKGYLNAIDARMRSSEIAKEQRREQQNSSKNFTFYIFGIVGILLVFFSAHTTNDSEWWNSHSYFIFAFGSILSIMFVLASIERSSLISDMLKYHSVKLLCAFLFSASVIYSSAQANNVLNAIFSVDGGNFPYSRALLSAVYFLKSCTPLMVILPVFILVHILVIWGFDRTKSWYVFPWFSLLFVVAGLIVSGIYWQITYSYFGDQKIYNKAYKLARHLDFNDKVFCAGKLKNESYVFIGSDQTKILVDKRPLPDESLEEFFKNNSELVSPTDLLEFEIRPCFIEVKKTPEISEH
jgi:hypothetical protein